LQLTPRTSRSSRTSYKHERGSVKSVDELLAKASSAASTVDFVRKGDNICIEFAAALAPLFAKHGEVDSRVGIANLYAKLGVHVDLRLIAAKPGDPEFDPAVLKTAHIKTCEVLYEMYLQDFKLKERPKNEDEQ